MARLHGSGGASRTGATQTASVRAGTQDRAQTVTPDRARGLGCADPTKDYDVHARVATWEGGDPDQTRASIDQIKERAASGPPEGVPAVGYLMLLSADASKILAITLYENEDDARQGDAMLNSMSPPKQPGMGQRTSVELYEVPVKIDPATRPRAVPS